MDTPDSKNTQFNRISRVRFRWKAPKMEENDRFLAIWFRYRNSGHYFEYEMEVSAPWQKQENGGIKLVHITNPKILSYLNKHLVHFAPQGALMKSVIVGEVPLKALEELEPVQIKEHSKTSQSETLFVRSDLTEWKKYYLDHHRM